MKKYESDRRILESLVKTKQKTKHAKLRIESGLQKNAYGLFTGS